MMSTFGRAATSFSFVLGGVLLGLGVFAGIGGDYPTCAGMSVVGGFLVMASLVIVVETCAENQTLVPRTAPFSSSAQRRNGAVVSTNA